MMKAAFYKGTRPGIAGVYNRLVRWWCNGPYSHVELIFSDGMAASSSFADGGVRFKAIDFDPKNWDIIDLSGFDEPAARRWFELHEGEPYDILGNLGFLWRPLRGRNAMEFCSEAFLSALGYVDTWRFCPNGTYSILVGAAR